MLTVNALAKMALEHTKYPTAIGALRDMNAAIAALESLGFPPEMAREHPIAVLLADRAGLMLRCEIVDNEQACAAYSAVRDLAHKS